VWSFNKDLLEFYREHTNNVLIPFWMRALDYKNGGVYNCFNNMGTELVSKDKFTWSQGRFIWVWARLASMCKQEMISGEASVFLDHAYKTVNFIWEHAILENGNCAYLLSETGEKKEFIPGRGYDISFYADCFVVLGFAEYARVTLDKDVLEKALKIYDRIDTRLKEGNVSSEPIPVPHGFAAQSFSMIMLNVTQELAFALETFKHQRFYEINNMAYLYMKDIMDRFSLKEGRVIELLPSEDLQKNTLLYRHVNPGHAIECMWFVMKEANKAGKKDWIQKAGENVKWAFNVGWDDLYGGLLRFTDCLGGEPKGILIGDPYEKAIHGSWDTKLWWPHSETLFTSLLAYKLTGDNEFLSMYNKTHEYTFRIFPNTDKEIGEWIQIRDRKGQPLDKITGLPVKDPYHILRNVLLTIEMLYDTLNEENDFIGKQA